MRTYQIAATLMNFRSTSDKGLRITFDTSSEINLETSANVQNSLHKIGVLAFSPDPFATKDLEEIDKIKVDYDDNSKSQGNRIRSVLYLLWKQHNEGYEQFRDYYNAKTEKYIEHLKSKIEPE